MRPFVLPLAVLLGGCVAAPSQDLVDASAPRPTPAVIAAQLPPAEITYSGELTQGGWIRGQAPAGTTALRLGDRAIRFAEDGRFFAAFDRDAGPATTLVATRSDGSTLARTLAVLPRAWKIERVNTPKIPGNQPSAEFLRQREGEVAQIAAARSRETGAQGWRQAFQWPARGRISGLFGSQRVYAGGEAGSYHSGIDIAGGQGGEIRAPADGVVILAAQTPFSLEGHLLMVDHGAGLNSAFLHCSELMVKPGDTVRQGQLIARIGMSGRATGPHLHWSLMWQGARLDPLLFVGPMPG